MPDPRDPDEPEYDWLFSGEPRPDRRPPARRGSAGDQTGSLEETQAAPPPFPVSDAPTPNPDHTQVLAAQPRDTAPATGSKPPASAATPTTPTAPAATTPAAAPTTSMAGPTTPTPTTRLPTTTPPSTAPTSGPQSFGGTFPAPARPTPQSRPSPSPQSGVATRHLGTAPPTRSAPYVGAPPTPPGATPAGLPPEPRKRRRNWWLRGLLILFVAWLIFLVVVPIWAWQKISKVDADPGGQRPSETAGTTYLLVGSDSRAGLTKQQRGDLATGDAAGSRTDTIILLHVPDNNGPTLLLSVPRDSYVNIPGHGMNKINAAYAFGGPKLLVQTIEQATNVRVDDYIEIGFAGFVDAVDAVGGITVCPTEKIDDPKAGHLKMSKGCHDIDGHTALDYSRSRAFALGDITRAQHQREVITAVGSKAASWQTVLLPWRYFKINKAAGDTLQVGENVGPIDLARFAWAMAHTGGSNAKRCVVPYSSLGQSTSVGSALIWDKAKSKAVFQDIRDDDTAAIDCSATGQ